MDSSNRSGAAKRKRSTQIKLQALAKENKKMTTFFPVVHRPANCETQSAEENEESTTNLQDAELSDEGESLVWNFDQNSSMEPPVLTTDLSTIVNNEDNTTQMSLDCEDRSEKNSSDTEKSREQEKELTKITINMFTSPSRDTLEQFLKFHPVQPSALDYGKLPFNPKYVFAIGTTKRLWITYSRDQDKLFCFVCMGFGSLAEQQNRFVLGLNDWAHVHQRIEEHEKTNTHENSTTKYFLYRNRFPSDALLFPDLISTKQKQVHENRKLFERIIDVIKVIGKQGLPFRGRRFEKSVDLSDHTVNHGNFLELILLVGKYDPVLQSHVQKVITEGQQRAETIISRGRGSFQTFLSKTTVNTAIASISSLLKSKMASDINSAGMFSIQIDSTQDISVKEQCSVIIRYVTDTIHERLLAVMECESTTGEDSFKAVQNLLTLNKINIKNCVRCSTDGAANMQGKYNGFRAWLEKASPPSVYVWCYAHQLNLVVQDTVKSCISATTFFNAMNGCASVIRDSHKRMLVWRETVGPAERKILANIGQTRWWSKHVETKKIFGNFENPQDSLYVELVTALHLILNFKDLKPDTRATVQGYRDYFLRYDTILLAHIFLRIFQHTTPLSKLLQTNEVLIIKCYEHVQCTLKQLQDFSRDFKTIVSATNKFVTLANNKFEQAESDLIVEESMPAPRQRKKKKMSGEVSADDRISDPLTRFEVEVHNVIMDSVVTCIESRFGNNKALFIDMSYLDPNAFDEIQQALPPQALSELHNHLLKFDPECKIDELQFELKELAINWDSLKLSLNETYTLLDENNEVVSEDDDVDSDQDLVSEAKKLKELKNCKKCRNCIPCVYDTLKKYNVLSSKYRKIGKAYQFILTLSSTQVKCERSFSTLKFIKNRLRSCLGQDNLDGLMLMFFEKVQLESLTYDEIIDVVAKTTPWLRKL